MSAFASLPVLFAQADRLRTWDGLSGAVQMLILAAVMVLPFLAGIWLARWLRMRDYAMKIGVVLFTVVAGLTTCVLRWPPDLGIDLSGGVVLVYEVDQEAAIKTAVSKLLTDLNPALQRKSKELTAIPGEPGQILVSVPEGSEPAQVEKVMAEFVETPQWGLLPQGRQQLGDRPALSYRIAQQASSIPMDVMINSINKRINPSGVKEVTVRSFGKDQIEVIIPEAEAQETQIIRRLISDVGSLEFRILANRGEDKNLMDAAERNPAATQIYEGGYEVARWVRVRDKESPSDQDVVSPTRAYTREVEHEGKKRTEALVKIDQYNVNGSYLAYARSGHDEYGKPAVNFGMNTEGAQLFGQLTSEHLPNEKLGRDYLLSIILDDEVQSAATIHSQITSNGQITGSFQQEHVQFIVGVLNAGSLPAALNKQPIRDERIGSQLGRDTIESGQKAMLLSTIAVIVFMAVYYRFAGLVADLAVVLNVVLAVALMILIKAAFTLPGLAGLVLTVGMAVDANVLIYERMREEAARGASLRMTIRNGYTRAMSTIVDSNLTTIISAVVLYMIGTDQVKGFAVTLILGLLVSLYTAVFVSRVIFDVFERQRWISGFKMMQLIGATKIDFVRWVGPAVTGSVVVIAIGMIGVFARGRGLLDIDFTGGYTVTAVFDDAKPQQVADVRQKLQDLPDVAISAVGQGNKERLYHQFKIDTSEHDVAVVREKLMTAFGEALRTYKLTYAPPAAIAGRAAADQEKGATTEGEKPGGATKSPASGDGARRDLPGRDELALAPSPLAPLAAVAFGQNDGDSPPADKAPEQPPTDAPAATPDTPAADATKPDTAATAKPESPPAAAEKPADAAPPAGAASDAGKKPEAAATDPFAGGGSQSALHFSEKISNATLRERINAALKGVGLPGSRFDLTAPGYKAGSSTGLADWTLQSSLSVADTEKLLATLKHEFESEPVFSASSEIGGKVAGHAWLLAVYALLVSFLAIILYVWVRFQSVTFGLAAVLALVHDVLVTVGFLALSSYLAIIPGFDYLLVDPFKISLAVVAALLTIIGYSVNDTIVIFDRIREIRGKSPDLNETMINRAVNETLSRTLLTSGTVLLGTLILYFIGGQGIHPFAYAMLIGLISGTYSTVYIASPLLLWLRRGPEPTKAVAAAPRSAAVR